MTEVAEHPGYDPELDPAQSENGQPPEGRLIDPDAYQSEELRLPTVDDQHVDRIYASFGGRAWLDRVDPGHCALIRDMRMGQTVRLVVEATVAPALPGYTTNRDGDLDSITLGRKFTITALVEAS